MGWKILQMREEFSLIMSEYAGKVMTAKLHSIEKLKIAPIVGHFKT